MNNYSNNIVFNKEKKKTITPKIKFILAIILMILIAVSVLTSFLLKNLLYIPELSKEEAIKILYIDDSVNEKIKKAAIDYKLSESNPMYSNIFDVNDLNNINRSTRSLTTDLIISYSDIKINTNCNVIFEYKDNKWIITDIKDLKAGDLSPAISAGSYFLDKLYFEVLSLGGFSFNGTKYNFDKDYIKDLIVLKESGNTTETTVYIGNYNKSNEYSMVATLSFDFEKLQWVLKNLELR
ncbi:hypothetical protein [Clostridium sp.]|uniref:hypothetical protein n=1 Tax=Clostridium sp. TaxID=1506 RepID=UPI0025BC9B7C|nr:hypothetical protein [Clostridium sp.]